MSKKILVVIDVQNDFVDGSLRNEEAIKRIPNIVKKIREFNGDAILVTQDTHEKDYLSTKEGKKLPVEHCIRGTEGWKINDNVMAALTDAQLRNINVTYIPKPTFGSLDLSTVLMKELRDLDWENYATSMIEFVGFCTDICVVSNVLITKANFYDTNVVVDASCCAGVTPETHKAALDTMKMCQIDIVNE